jgi:hypothetical protein
MARAVDEAAHEHDALAVALDGPHAWRDPATPPDAPGAGRRAEFALATQGKLGVHPLTYPRTQRAWCELSIDVFDALLALPQVNLAPDRPHDGYRILETYPTGTWRALGLAPLPAKSKRPELAGYAAALAGRCRLPDFAPATHDDLQAVVAALAALATVLPQGRGLEARAHGEAARDVLHADGVVRRVEGYIWTAE